MNMTKKWYISHYIMLMGLLFLYLPMVILIFYSFNESKLVTIWSGFSTKWYGALFEDEQLMSAVWMSLKVAFYSATTAVILGGLSAYACNRLGKFKGKTLFNGMINAPLVMPDVMIGISLLLFFVTLSKTLGIFETRGLLTIWIAHVTLGTAYVCVVVLSRLKEMDTSLEEAAMDLGATPLNTFLAVTLPIILPSLIAGWCLAFTLSLDDLVIASFVSGPSATTLPMLIFSSIKMGVTPIINALATLIIGLVSLITFVAWWWHSRENLK